MTPSNVKSTRPLAATVVTVAHGPAAAIDDSASTVSNDQRNPLWIIAIGMACFFGAAALVMMLS